MRKFYFIVFLLISALSFVRPIKAQNVPSVIDDAYALIEGGKYKESLVLLQNIDESQTYEHGDSCIMMYNYEMGACFYFFRQIRGGYSILEQGSSENGKAASRRLHLP